MRITPGSRRDVGTLTWLLAHVSGRITRTAPPALFLVLGRHRPLFRAWLHFAARLMPGGALPRRDTELTILRVAHLTRCDYELAHHTRLATRAGLTPDDVTRVRQGPTAPGWSPRDHALLTAVDHLHTTRDLDDPTWAALRAHLSEQHAIEFLLLTGHYTMLATTLTTLRITPDPLRS